MQNIYRILIIAAGCWILTLTPWGYELGYKIFNNPIHNQVYCGVFSVLDKHPTTEPSLKYWNSYLNKCMVVDSQQEKKIEEFLKTNKEKLKQKVKTIEFRLENDK